MNHTHYINCTSLTPRAFFLRDILNWLPLSLIVTPDKDAKKLNSLLQFLGKSVRLCDDISSIVHAKTSEYTYIFPQSIFYTPLPTLWQLEHEWSLVLKKNDILPPEEIIQKIADFGYTFSDVPEEWEYKKTGDTLQIHLFGQSGIYFVHFFDDMIEDIFFQKDGEMTPLDTIIVAKKQKIETQEWTVFQKDILEYLKEKHWILDNIDIQKEYEYFLTLENITSIDILHQPEKHQISLQTSDVMIRDIAHFTEILKWEKSVTVYTKNAPKIRHFLEYNSLSCTVIETKQSMESFQTPEKYVIADDCLSKIFIKKRLKKSVATNIDLLLQIKSGDYVVHIEHGIGLFSGIVQKEVGQKVREYVEIVYKNGDKLFVPILEIGRVSKYVGTQHPELHTLGTQNWTKKLQKAQEDVQKVAFELLEIYAKRQIIPGYSFQIFEEKLLEFQADFPYEYTKDQILSIEDILQDMHKSTPMDRMLVWDVGFGKTEVAFQAIYTAYLNKKLSVLLSPLVVLAYEHYEKALERFADFGVRIELLTRFQTKKEEEKIHQKIKNGEIDLLVATHKALSSEIDYTHLGLLVIDEEHKFGVKDKEKIQTLKGNVDILSMSATPIPRSLNMALSELKGFSILSQAPQRRKWVETFVSEWSESVIMSAFEQEFARNGQVFFIHNRVQTIEKMAEYLQSLFPKKTILVTHGQLPGQELEKRIFAFKNMQADILISSTVIENGIDFPNVNTILINDAYQFGISQIHQLRGRVGRGDQKWYCYLLFNREKLTPEAGQRLTTLVEYSHLWAGFELAIRDLEIRWGGDILGVQQSGISTQIGINVYLKMLEEKVQELKALRENITPQNQETTIDLQISAYIDDGYFASDLDKMNFYREIESVQNLEDLEHLKEDFAEYFSGVSESNLSLFRLLEVRILAKRKRIARVCRMGVSYSIQFFPDVSFEEVRNFLDRDKKGVCYLESKTSIKISCQSFANDEAFLGYLYTMIQ